MASALEYVKDTSARMKRLPNPGKKWTLEESLKDTSDELVIVFEQHFCVSFHK